MHLLHRAYQHSGWLQGGGEKQTFEVHEFDGAGVAMGMYNTDDSISGFAKASFEFALERKQ